MILAEWILRIIIGVVLNFFIILTSRRSIEVIMRLQARGGDGCEQLRQNASAVGSFCWFCSTLSDAIEQLVVRGTYGEGETHTNLEAGMEFGSLLPLFFL